MFEYYRRLIHLRNAQPALQLGDYQTLLADDAKELFVFSRTHENQTIIVAINNGRQEQQVNIVATCDGEFIDLLEGSQRFAVTAGHIVFAINAQSGRILKGYNIF